MIVTLPLRLTGSGSDSNIPNIVDIIYSDGTQRNNVAVIDSTITIRPFFMSKSNGYDSNNSRITNVVGFDGTNLLKLCPNCSNTRTTNEFGESGRGSRDQSHCNICRAGR